MDFDVVELGPSDHVTAGDTAPAFERPLVTGEYWEDRSLADVCRDGGILVFTPMVGSFVARYLWTELLDREWPSRHEGPVVGVSVSTPFAVSRFVDEHGVPDGMFADPGNDVAELFGVVHDLDGMTGISEPRPAIVAVDGDLTVEAAWVATEWPEFPPYDDLEATLGLS